MFQFGEGSLTAEGEFLTREFTKSKANSYLVSGPPVGPYNYDNNPLSAAELE